MQRHSTCIGWPLPTQNHNRPLLRPWIINYEANAEKLTRMHPPVGRGASRDSSPAPTSLGFPPAYVQVGDPRSFRANGSSPFEDLFPSWMDDWDEQRITSLRVSEQRIPIIHPARKSGTCKGFDAIMSGETFVPGPPIQALDYFSNCYNYYTPS